MATKNLSEVLDYRCVGCDTKVTPGDTGATYSGRTGFICCPECSEGGVPFTLKLAKALTDRGLWTEHWEAYVNGHGTSPERGMCKHPECFKARPPGRGYCTQEHYMEAEGNAKAAKAQAQADYEAEHQAERAGNPKAALADRMFPSLPEWERDDILDDLIRVMKDEMA